MLKKLTTHNKINLLVNQVIPSAVIYTILFHLPTAFYIAHQRFAVSSMTNILMAFSELITIFLFTISIFAIAATINKKLLYAVLVLFYAIGGIGIYFLLNFGKNLGMWSISAIIYDDSNFIHDMIGTQLLLIMSISIIIGLLSTLANKIHYRFSLLVIYACSICFITSILWFNTIIIENGINNYAPYPEFKGAMMYIINKNQSSEKKLKQDINNIYDFSLRINKNKKPLTVIMVIGESLRGDVLQINGYKRFANTPLLQTVPNIASFKYGASQCSATTHAIPSMLTKYRPHDVQNKYHFNDSTFISVFRKLGFKTAWIGAQSSFSQDNIDIPLEAEYIITRKEIMGLNGRQNIYDSDMLPIIRQYINQNQNVNKLIVVHMMGSHWRFDYRYPVGFGAFYPICRNASPISCSNDELENGYHNTVLYTDYFLYNLISIFAKENAFLFFASDHGSHITSNNFEGINEENEQ